MRKGTKTLTITPSVTIQVERTNLPAQTMPRTKPIEANRTHIEANRTERSQPQLTPAFSNTYFSKTPKDPSQGTNFGRVCFFSVEANSKQTAERNPSCLVPTSFRHQTPISPLVSRNEAPIITSDFL
jgi:hypothetical protein